MHPWLKQRISGRTSPCNSLFLGSQVRNGQKRPGVTRADLAIRAEGPNIIEANVTWPADSGEDIKVPGLGWGAAVAYSNVNWWDPNRKAYGVNVAGREVARAYAKISGGDLPPLAEARRPEARRPLHLHGGDPRPGRGGGHRGERGHQEAEHEQGRAEVGYGSTTPAGALIAL